MKLLKTESIFQKEVLILALVLLTAPWTWIIFSNNILLGLLLILICLIFFQLLIKKVNNIYLMILCLSFFLVFIINLQIGFDRAFRTINFNEEVQQNDRFRYFSKELGKLFLNKYTLNFYKNYSNDITKFQNNFFSGLDINLYFFASHPRERAGISEFEKLPSVYVIFFILGILYILQIRSFPALLFLLTTAFLNSFISPAFKLGPVLFFPFVIVLTALGILSAITFLKYLIKR